MSRTGLVEVLGRRAVIPLVFLFSGGAAGGFAISALLAVSELIAGQPGEALGKLLVFSILFAGAGVVAGAPAALIAGIVYAVLPSALQRIVLAPVVGAASALAVYVAMGSSLDAYGGSSAALMAYAGAAAAAFCAWYVRLLKLDARTALGEVSA